VIAKKSTLQAVQPEENLAPILKNLVHAVGAHSIQGGPDDYQHFRGKVQQLADSMDGFVSVTEGSMLVERLVRALREHATRFGRRQSQLSAEIQSIIAMLMDTFDGLGIASPERMKELHKIGGDLTASTEAQQLKVAKLSLSTCLSEIRREAERQLGDRGDAAKDGITNLEGRSTAETAIVEACASDASRSAVVVLVERMPMYNLRYGREVGDKILHFVSGHVRSQFPPEYQLFRWSGPALLMLHAGSAEQNEFETRRVMDQKLCYDLDTNGRTVLLPVSVRCAAFPMMVDPRLVINKIDTFVADQDQPGS
jgi:GGDEF domain-containing protein